MSRVYLSEMQRLIALLKAFRRDVRHLASVQRRITAILLAAGCLELTEDTLDTLEAMLTEATTTLTLMQFDVLSAREAADSGVGTNQGECAI